MNYVFFGTPRFAAVILNKLLKADMKPIGVVTNPDRPVGRTQEITPPPVKQVLQQHELDIPVWQPEKLKDISEELEGIHPDLFVVAAYGKIIPQSILDIPMHGSVNVHPSLLPAYRGATPIQSALLDGVAETGVTLMMLDEEMDHGPLVAQTTAPVNEHTHTELETILAEMGAELLITWLPKLMRGEVTPTPQDHEVAIYTKKFTTDDGYVSYAELKKAVQGDDPDTAEKIGHMIRALNPEPGVWTETEDDALYNLPAGKRVKLLEGSVRDRALHLHVIQVAGKNPRSLV